MCFIKHACFTAFCVFVISSCVPPEPSNVAPQPVLNEVAPPVFTVGAPDTVLSVIGHEFRAQSVVLWDGTPLVTTFVDDSHLLATVSATLLTASAFVQVTVHTDAPGGGTSSAATIGITESRDIPFAADLYPDAVLDSDGGTLLRVYGSGISENTVVFYDDVELVTAYLGRYAVSATLPGQLVPGDHAIRLLAPDLSDGLSNDLTLSVGATNPKPVIVAVTPSTLAATGANAEIEIAGTGFTASSTVLWNGAPIMSAFNGEFSLHATVPGTMLLTGNFAMLEVQNPAPGGGGASPVEVVVANPLPVLATISPDFASPGTPTLVVTASGSGFNPATRGYFEDQELNTLVLSDATLLCEVPGKMLGSTGNFNITVRNPLPEGGASQPMLLHIQPVPVPPVLAGIQPDTILNSDTFVNLSVFGDNFQSLSKVLIDDTELEADFIDTHELRIVLPDGQFPAGVHTVRVLTASAAGGLSNAASLTILAANGRPALLGLDPAAFHVGDPESVLTVFGEGFVKGATVSWNEIPLTTDFVDTTQLAAVVPVELLEDAGTAEIAVENPAPGGGVSDALPIEVQNPVPVLTGISPSRARLPQLSLFVAATGRDFTAATSLYMNATRLDTTFVNSSLISAVLNEDDLTAAGDFDITAATPGPSGGVSAAATLALLPDNKFVIQSRDFIYDPARDLIYVAGASTDEVYSNLLHELDPETLVSTPLSVLGSNPGQLVFTDDHKYIYAALDGAGRVVRYRTDGNTVDLDFALGTSTYGTQYAEDIVTIPGAPDTVAVSLKRLGVSPRHDGVAIYDNGVRRPVLTQNHTGSNRIEYSGASGVLVGYNNETTEYGLRHIQISDDGLHQTDVARGVLSGFSWDFACVNSVIYCGSGRIVDAVNFQMIATLSNVNLVCPILDNGIILGMDSGNPESVNVYDADTFILIGVVPLDDVLTKPKFIRHLGGDRIGINDDYKKIAIYSDPGFLPKF